MTLIFADAAAIIGAGAAVVGVALTAIGLIIRFRPKFDVAIDERREAIRIKVSNKGRLMGRINSVSVMDADEYEVPPEFASLPDGKFHSGRVAHKESRSLVIKATERKPFADDVRVFFQWGRHHEREIVPEHRKEISYFNEESNWPRLD